MFETLSIKLEAICFMRECVVTRMLLLLLLFLVIYFVYGLLYFDHYSSVAWFRLNAFFYLLSSFSFFLCTQLDADVQCSDFNSLCSTLSLSLHLSCVALSLSPFIYFSFLGPVRQFSWYRLSKCEVKISYNLVVLLSLVFPRLHKINEIVSLQHVFTKLFDIENLFRLVQLFFLCVLKREDNKQAGRQAGR